MPGKSSFRFLTPAFRGLFLKGLPIRHFKIVLNIKLKQDA
ncbi:MAG: hypothetical protein QG657_3644 [Acidobacteriota bacterium]|nr:hypothetical protein [Acidobacteriota bacterium]